MFWFLFVRHVCSRIDGASWISSKFVVFPILEPTIQDPSKSLTTILMELFKRHLTYVSSLLSYKHSVLRNWMNPARFVGQRINGYPFQPSALQDLDRWFGQPNVKVLLTWPIWVTPAKTIEYSPGQNGRLRWSKLMGENHWTMFWKRMKRVRSSCSTIFHIFHGIRTFALGFWFCARRKSVRSQWVAETERFEHMAAHTSF